MKAQLKHFRSKGYHSFAIDNSRVFGTYLQGFQGDDKAANILIKHLTGSEIFELLSMNVTDWRD